MIGEVKTNKDKQKDKEFAEKYIKAHNKSREFKDGDREKVMEDLREQIQALRHNQSNYKTLAKLAAGYLMTSKSFRNKCSEDSELNNLIQIYNEVYVEHIMNKAINEGKINSQTEDGLKNEMNAYTNQGTEQLVQGIIDNGDNTFMMYNEETKAYDTPITITTDKEDRESAGIFNKTVEVENGK